MGGTAWRATTADELDRLAGALHDAPITLSSVRCDGSTLAVPTELTRWDLAAFEPARRFLWRYRVPVLAVELRVRRVVEATIEDTDGVDGNWVLDLHWDAAARRVVVETAIPAAIAARVEELDVEVAFGEELRAVTGHRLGRRAPRWPLAAGAWP